MVSRPLRALLLCLALVAPGVFAASDPARIDIDITTHLGDRQVFAEGDLVSFFLSLERDAYVYLFYRDAENNLLQLLPNAGMPAHLYRGGMFMPLPSAEQAYQFIVVPPFGDELILAFASDNGHIELPGEELESGLLLLGVDANRVEEIILEASARSFGRTELRLKTQPVESGSE